MNKFFEVIMYPKDHDAIRFLVVAKSIEYFYDNLHNLAMIWDSTGMVPMSIDIIDEARPYLDIHCGTDDITYENFIAEVGFEYISPAAGMKRRASWSHVACADVKSAFSELESQYDRMMRAIKEEFFIYAQV